MKGNQNGISERRNHSAHLNGDRGFSEDMKKIQSLIESGELPNRVEKALRE
jgi:histidine ammonia-lyase